MINDLNSLKWADAHTFYNAFDQIPSDNRPGVEKAEYLWHQRLSQETPNGKLLTQNSFFNNLKKSDKVYLNHTTYNLDKIVESGVIHASGGCLIGSIYCTPLTMTSGGLRLHNLGQYIYRKEAPAGNESNNKILDSLIFEVNLSKNENNNLIGIDYLRLGNIHFAIFNKLKYLLSSKERYDLEETIVSRIKRSNNFLSLSNYLYFSKDKYEKNKYIDLFIETIQDIPFLGYLYFETLSEYLMLHQDSKIAKSYSDIGEFYNQPYKELMYRCIPKLVKNFTLKDFQPRVSDVFEVIKELGCIENPDWEQFTDYLFDRLVFYTNSRIFSDLEKPIVWQDISWNFEEMSELFRPLAGHIIHRELRSFGRYPDFYFYFDQLKALEVWNYWNHMNIAIPFNGVIPKGEIGINPAYTDLKYKVYQGRVTERNGFDFIEPVKELKIELIPRLVDLKFSFMRNKDSLKND